jgi:hypothetical protein
MITSDKIDQVATSLYAVQRELRNPPPNARADIETKSGRTFGYDYLSLPKLIDVVREAFKAVSLAYVQEITQLGTGIGVTTRIMHGPSGQWVELGPLPVPCAPDAQAVGSAITYGRRYALAAAVGIAADEDDDAAGAAERDAAHGEGASPTVAAPGSGSAVEGALAPAPPSPADDKQRLMDEYHAGKPHRMVVSETVPSVKVCKQASPAQYGCPYTEPAPAIVGAPYG